MRVERLIGGLAAVVVAAGAMGTGRATEVAISCGAVVSELENCRIGVAGWEKQTGNAARVVATPNESNARLAMYQQLLAAGDASVDVLQIDVVWPATIAGELIDLKPFTHGDEAGHFPAMIANDTVAGRLVALPWYTDAGLLYYRKDLLDKYGLSVPETWDELIADAKTIQDGERAAGNAKFWGYLFQGKAYEGLTCNGLEWIDSFGGGTLLSDDGAITVDNPRAIKALETWAGLIGTIAPKGVLSYGEEESRAVWQGGNAAFIRHWPYIWALGNAANSPIRGLVGVAPLPMGPDGKHSATLGGWQLAVSKFSAHPDVAASLVLYLTGAAEQKRRAIAGSFNPTRPDVYRDPDVQAANPFMSSLYSVFLHAAARPSTATASRYNKVSNAFWNAVYAVLSKRKPADRALSALKADLTTILRP